MHIQTQLYKLNNMWHCWNMAMRAGQRTSGSMVTWPRSVIAPRWTPRWTASTRSRLCSPHIYRVTHQLSIYLLLTMNEEVCHILQSGAAGYVKGFWEFHRQLGWTAAAMLPKQARRTHRKHLTKPSEQVAAPDCIHQWRKLFSNFSCQFARDRSIFRRCPHDHEVLRGHPRGTKCIK